MDELYVPNGLVRIPLGEPVTTVTTSIATPTSPEIAAPISMGLFREAIDSTSEL